MGAGLIGLILLALVVDWKKWQGQTDLAEVNLAFLPSTLPIFSRVFIRGDKYLELKKSY